MADIHVLTGDGERRVTFAFHFPIANSNNPVGINWRTALTRSGLGGTTSLPDGDGTGGTISAAEKASVESGAVYEHLLTFPLRTGGTSAGQLLATVQARYAAEQTRVLAELQDRLEFYGYTASAT